MCPPRVFTPIAGRCQARHSYLDGSASRVENGPGHGSSSLLEVVSSRYRFVALLAAFFNPPDQTATTAISRL
jgi:hypothetical protein